MKKSKIEYQLFKLISEGGNVLLKARCNEEYLISIINKMKKEQEENDYPYSDQEALEEIFVKDNVDYEILTPKRIGW